MNKHYNRAHTGDEPGKGPKVRFSELYIDEPCLELDLDQIPMQ